MCTVDHEKKKSIAEDSNLDLVSQIIQQNTLELTILKSIIVFKAIVDNPYHIKINSQLNVSTIKIDLNFLETPQRNGDNYVNF